MVPRSIISRNFMDTVWDYVLTKNVLIFDLIVKKTFKQDKESYKVNGQLSNKIVFQISDLDYKERLNFRLWNITTKASWHLYNNIGRGSRCL